MQHGGPLPLVRPWVPVPGPPASAPKCPLLGPLLTLLRPRPPWPGGPHAALFPLPHLSSDTSEWAFPCKNSFSPQPRLPHPEAVYILLGLGHPMPGAISCPAQALTLCSVLPVCRDTSHPYTHSLSGCPSTQKFSSPSSVAGSKHPHDHTHTWSHRNTRCPSSPEVLLTQQSHSHTHNTLTHLCSWLQTNTHMITHAHTHIITQKYTLSLLPRSSSHSALTLNIHTHTTHLCSLL